MMQLRVEVVRGFQHNLLKLLAFAEWWHNIEQGEQFCSLFRAPTRRSIFDNGDLYANHACWSIASYLIVPNDCFIDPNKRVNLSLCNMSRMDAMSIQPLIHSLHLWYYPPCVMDVCTDFKLAAHGYAKCLDTLIPTKGFKHMLDKQDNQRADKGMSIFFNPFWPSTRRHGGIGFGWHVKSWTGRHSTSGIGRASRMSETWGSTS